MKRQGDSLRTDPLRNRKVADIGAEALAEDGVGMYRVVVDHRSYAALAQALDHCVAPAVLDPHGEEMPRVSGPLPRHRESDTCHPHEPLLVTGGEGFALMPVGVDAVELREEDRSLNVVHVVFPTERCGIPMLESIPTDIDPSQAR